MLKFFIVEYWVTLKLNIIFLISLRIWSLLYKRGIIFWIFGIFGIFWIFLIIIILNQIRLLILSLSFKYFFIWKIIKRRLSINFCINFCIYSFFAHAHDLFYIHLFLRLFIFIFLKHSNPCFYIHHFKKSFSIIHIHESLNVFVFRFCIKFFRFAIWAVHYSTHEPFWTLSLFQFIFISILFHYKLLFF